MKIYLFLLSVICMFLVNAQDLHFSQTAQTPLLINPACAGVFDGWQRVIVNQRTQWMGTTTSFKTTSLAGDVTLFKKERGNKGYLGIGAIFNSDVGGDGRFGSQVGTLSLSGVLPMGKTGHIFSVGLLGGFGSRKGDISSLSFENQWNSTPYAFDQSLPSGEVQNLNNFSYLDIGTGFYYIFNPNKSTFARNNEFKFQLGASVYHLNEPILKYTSGSDDRLHKKFVFHSGIIKDFVGSNVSLDASIVQFIQGGHFETILGSMARYRFQEGTKITGFSQNAYVGFGLYMRVKDAIIPSIMVDYKGFKFGVSYDVTISKLRRAYGGGSLEFSLSFSNLNKGLFSAAR